MPELGTQIAAVIFVQMQDIKILLSFWFITLATRVCENVSLAFMLNESLPHDEFPFSLESLLLYNYYIRNRGLEIMPIFTADVVEIRESWQKI